MFSIEPPAVPLQTVVVAQVDAQSANKKKRTLGICMPLSYIAPNTLQGEGDGSFGPNHQAVNYFALYEKREFDIPSAKSVQVLKDPKYGSIAPYRNPASNLDLWRYVPKSGFVGDDSAEFLVDVKGMPVHVVYFFKVTKLNLDDGSAGSLCKKFEWKISSSDSNSGNLAAWQRSTEFSALLGDTSLSLAGFQNLK